MSLFQNSSALCCLSFRRKPESSEFRVFWTPVFTGVTVIGPPEQVSIVSNLMKRYTSQSRVQRFRQLRDGYNLRSSVAHGNLMRELNDEELELTTELEEALRKLIRMYLKNPGQFQAAVLNRLTLGVEETH